MINSEKFSLIDLFTKQDEEHNLPLSNIEIPIIQRDYAQGRQLPEVERIRVRFLTSLYEALTKNKNLALDFIYGNIVGSKLIPLDGQQRLTTLFLLHWYIAKHENISNTTTEFLKGFSYATRYSAREFCMMLVEYTPNFSFEKLSDDITDQNWMPRDWQHDPTISSMLTMIDSIHTMFKKTSDLWQRLENGVISFYFLSLEELGATDELYIKMNSRGKPLTEFEHFKAEWEGFMKEVNPVLAESISRKIDLEWTDMLWPYRDSGLGNDEDCVIDDEFVRFFRYLSDIIYNKTDLQKVSNDIFAITKQLYSKENPNAEENIKFIESVFDALCEVRDINSLFVSFLTTENAFDGKSIVSAPIDVFGECCCNYSEQQKGQKRKFSIGRFVLLYAFVVYILHKEEIAEENFRTRIRIIVNLIHGSEFELREDNLPNLIRQTEYVILNGAIELGYSSFGTNQVAEEIEKVEWFKDNPDKIDLVHKLEDHRLLNGAVRAIGLENVDYADKFYSLFSCDWSLVNRAMLTQGDYSLFVNWRYQLGTKYNETTWRSIFRTKKDDLQECRRILTQLMGKAETFTDKELELIISDYLKNEKIFDWRYYIIKYSSMRWERYGMYYWYDYNKRGKDSYKILMMWTEKSITGRNKNIFLAALYSMLNEKGITDVSLGEYAYYEEGSSIDLDFAEKYLKFDDDKIVIYHYDFTDDEQKIEKIDIEKVIKQNDNGRDLEDRVELAYNIILDLYNTQN